MIVQEVFAHAYVLGGAPCSGKSTLAEMLAARFPFLYYKVDDHDRQHAARSRPDRQPVMYKYSRMTCDEIWLRPVLEQVQDELSYYRERFEMIVADLERLAARQPVLLEGAALLPELIARYPIDRHRVVFLVPSDEFQNVHYRERGWVGDVLKDCSDPEQAFANWMVRDHLFGQEILRQAKEHQMRTIVVDGSTGADGQYKKLAAYFGLSADRRSA